VAYIGGRQTCVCPSTLLGSGKWDKMKSLSEINANIRKTRFKMHQIRWENAIQGGFLREKGENFWCLWPWFVSPPSPFWKSMYATDRNKFQFITIQKSWIHWRKTFQFHQNESALRSSISLLGFITLHDMLSSTISWEEISFGNGPS